MKHGQDDETVDSWIDQQAPAPRAIGEPAHKPPAKRKSKAELARSLREAPVAARPAKPAGDPPPQASAEEPRDDAGAPPDEPPPHGRKRGSIFEGSPVTALGVFGDISWYLDTTGQLRGVDNHTAQKMLHVFGGKRFLLGDRFPMYAKDGSVSRGKFNQLALSGAMIEACVECGVWKPVGKVRGAGAWRDDDGGLIYHAGDEVLMGGEWVKPGVYDGKVYPAADPVPRPSDKGGDAAAEIFELFQTWHWRRRDIDPMLTLGLLCAALMGGALEWRPVGWFTGDKATGKSHLQRLFLYLCGGEAGLLQAADATEAGIRSVIGFSSLPVAVDELEPDKVDPRKVKAVIELARRAASGGAVFRGSSDQTGHQSVAMSSFLFSSILVPDMPSQDRSRLILLDLDAFPDDAPKPENNPRRWRQLGAQLRRRLIDGWPTWAERLDLWREALAKHGQHGRGGDNYATVLAMADMALHSELPTADVLDAQSAKVAHGVTEDSVEVGSNADDMLTWLLSRPIDIWRRGATYTVAQWIACAAQLDGSPTTIGDTEWDKINGLLASYGLRVFGRKAEAQLAIATKQLVPLLQLFEGSDWRNGVWAQACRRIAGAEARNLTMANIATRVWVVPFKSIPGLLNLATDSTWPVGKPAAPAEDADDFA